MKMIRALLLLSLLGMPLACLANWEIDKDQSSITYLAVKMIGSKTLFENNRFTNFAGKLDSDGDGVLWIDLNSVMTGIGIRDERVKEYVFDVKNHPQATISLSIGEIKAADYQSVQAEVVEASLTMRGVTQRVNGDIGVSRVGDDLLVQTLSPILIDAKDYGMLEGFETLKNIAQLSGIPTIIPVSFRLLFVAPR